MVVRSRTEQLRRMAAAQWEASWGAAASLQDHRTEGLVEYLESTRNAGTGKTPPRSGASAAPDAPQFASNEKRAPQQEPLRPLNEALVHLTPTTDFFENVQSTGVVSVSTALESGGDRWTTGQRLAPKTFASGSAPGSADQAAKPEIVLIQAQQKSLTPSISKRTRENGSGRSRVHAKPVPESSFGDVEARTCAFIEQWLWVALTANKTSIGTSQSQVDGLIMDGWWRWNTPSNACPWTKECVSLAHVLEKLECERLAASEQALDRLQQRLCEVRAVSTTAGAAAAAATLGSAGHVTKSPSGVRGASVPGETFPSLDATHSPCGDPQAPAITKTTTATTMKLTGSASAHSGATESASSRYAQGAKLPSSLPVSGSVSSPDASALTLEREPHTNAHTRAYSKPETKPIQTSRAGVTSKDASPSPSPSPRPHTSLLTPTPASTLAPDTRRDASVDASTRATSAIDGTAASDAPTTQVSRASPETALPADVQQVLDHYTQICNLADKFQQDPASQSLRFQLRKRINLAVNQIGLSLPSVLHKSSVLAALLHESLTTETAIESSESVSLLDAWLQLQVVRRIVREGAEQVVVSLPSSFALGAVLVLLTQQHPRLKPVVLGTFYQLCPYTIPHWYRRRPGESLEAYLVRLGYSKPNESFESYCERMGGYLSLFAAMLQTALPNMHPNPYGTGMLWTWSARVVNAKPRRMTCLLLGNVFEVAGYALSQQYGNQFRKLLRLVEAEVLPRLPKDAPPGPTARLKHWIEEALRSGPQPCPGHILPMRDSQNT